MEVSAAAAQGEGLHHQGLSGASPMASTGEQGLSRARVSSRPVAPDPPAGTMTWQMPEKHHRQVCIPVHRERRDSIAPAGHGYRADEAAVNMGDPDGLSAPELGDRQRQGTLLLRADPGAARPPWTWWRCRRTRRPSSEASASRRPVPRQSPPAASFSRPQQLCRYPGLTSRGHGRGDQKCDVFVGR